MDTRYFDYAATSPTRPVAIQAMAQAMSCLTGNPSSPHVAGRNAQLALHNAKQEMLDLLNCSDAQLVLCASASEANNLVIQHVLMTKPWAKVAISTDAHSSVLALRALYPERFYDIPINKSGHIEQDQIAALLQEHSEIGLLCLNHVCHETGVVQDVQALSAYCERRELACLVDGTQAVGHIPIDLDSMSADWYVFAAHKFGGPLGCAGVVVKGDSLEARVVGGRQEYGMRAGTENTPALLGAVHALTEAMAELDSELARITDLKQQFIKELGALIPSVRILASEQTGGLAVSPFICACLFPDILAANMVEMMSVAGFSLANGSACTSEQREASPILLAMSYTEQEALSCVRISFGLAHTPAAVTALCEALAETYAQLLQQSH